MKNLDFLDSNNVDVSNAFVAGYLAALQSHEVAVDACIIDGTSKPAEIRTWIKDDITYQRLQKEQRSYEIAAADLRTLYKEPLVIEQALSGCRGILLNAMHVNDEGICLDADQKPAEGKDFQPLKGTEVVPWATFQAISQTTGEEINNDKYGNLPPAQQKEYYKLPFFTIPTSSGQLTRIYVNQRPYIERLIMDDMKRNPGIAIRYACELAAATSDQPTSQNGKLRDYYETVIQTLERLDPIIYDDTLVQQLQRGYIRSLGQLHIAILESAVKNFQDLNESIEIEYLIPFIEMVESLADPSKFDELFPADDRFAYRYANGKSLTRMQIDNDGKPNIITSGNATDAEFATYLQFLLQQLGDCLTQITIFSGKLKNPQTGEEKQLRQRLLKIANMVGSQP